MEELDLKQLMSIIWRKKIAIFIVVIIFAIIGSIYSYKYVKPMYKSTSTIILGKVTSSNGTTIGYDVNYPENSEMISQSDLSLNSSLIETYSELVKSKTLIAEVKSNLKLNIETENLMKAISVSRVNTSDLLEVTAIHEDSVIAKNIVSEVVRIFSDNVKEIYSISNVYIIDAANIPEEPYNVNHAKDIIIFIVIGIFISLGYILIYNIIDNTVKSSYDIENVLKLKTLITIPLGKKNKEELITIKESKSIISEAFRTLRTNVQFSNINSKEQKTLLITSCLPEEGKSYVSANLAITFAQAGKKVILVDSDMRRGRQAKIFNISNKNGLSNYISNIDNNGMELNWPLEKYIKKTSINNLKLITAGNIPPNPAELLESERVVELIGELKKSYDIIIFDGAPLLPITDSLLLARLLGKTMLVAVHNKTKKDNLLKAKSNIENVGGKVIGVCLNKVSEGASEYSDNYYYYSNPEKEIDSFEKLKGTVKNIVNKLKALYKKLKENIEEKRKEKEANKAKEAEEKVKKDAELAKKKEEERKIKEAEKAKEAEEKVKRDAELAKKKEEERKVKEANKAKEAEEKAKRDAELAEKRAEEAKIKEAEKIVKDAERKKKAEENKEKFNKKVEEFKKKFNELKEKTIVKNKELKEKLSVKKEKMSVAFAEKKEKFSEKMSIKKAEWVKKYQEYKIKKEEENKIKKEQKAIKDAENAKVREENRIKKEERKQELELERERIQAEIAKRKEEEKIEKEAEKQRRAEEKAIEQARIEEERLIKQAKLAEEKQKQAIEKAKRDAELAKKKEEEKIRREEERIKQAEEKAKREAEIIAQRAQKEAENLRIREEEKERRAREKEDAKYTDEYLEDNLYPKTKYNKF